MGRQRSFEIFKRFRGEERGKKGEVIARNHTKKNSTTKKPVVKEGSFCFSCGGGGGSGSGSSGMRGGG